MKRLISWYLLLTIAILGALSVYFLNSYNNKKVENLNRQRLEYTHNEAVNLFKSSVDRMGGLVAGMKSYVNMSENVPTEAQFQRFVQNQLNDVSSRDSIAVTVIDTNHIFRQAFTRYESDPVQLVGRSVREFRSEEKIEALVALMRTDSLKMFPPINIREGWLGIPIDFRIYRGAQVEGYVAPIINFSSIMSSIYDSEVSEDFVFKFITEDGYEFDRFRYYNGTKSFSTIDDEEYYKNFNVDYDSFILTTQEYFGYEITIGTAYKEVTNTSKTFTSVLIVSYLLLLTVLSVITWQAHRYYSLNTRLQEANSEIASQNKQLQDLNQTKNKFFSMISHDVRQPLHSIQSLMVLLQNEKTDDPSLNTLFEAIKRSTRNTVSLLNNLLRWALSQTGELSFNPVVCNLSELINGIVLLKESQAQQKAITIYQENDKSLECKADIDMLNTVLRNILSNAIKFTEQNGEIHIKTHKTQNNAVISISDNGIGMKPELVKTLFQIGENNTREGTNGEEGTGLGLILSYDFIKKHNGTITVESILGEGTTFLITIPVDV